MRSHEAHGLPRTSCYSTAAFVKRVGGELVTDLIENRNPQNADYFFPEHGVIGELKSLRAGSFADSFHRKLSTLMVKWQRQRRLIVFGTVHIQSSKLPEDCRNEMFDVMAESIQKHIVVAANRQIKSTKSLLNRPDAKGFIWVASDGNDDFQPEHVWYVLTRILQKKKPDGSPAYSGINGLAYFNPRMPAKIAGVPEPTLFWVSRSRQTEKDDPTGRCISSLAYEWPKYVTQAQGVNVRDVQGSPADVRFPSAKTFPKITPEYD